jgi:hypothetical protein
MANAKVMDARQLQEMKPQGLDPVARKEWAWAMGRESLLLRRKARATSIGGAFGESRKERALFRRLKGSEPNLPSSPFFLKIKFWSFNQILVRYLQTIIVLFCSFLTFFQGSFII